MNGLFSAWTRVVIRPPSARQSLDEWSSEALLNTGAELTHIPDMLAYRLELPLIRKTRLVGMSGSVVEGSVYLLSLESVDSDSYHASIEVTAIARDKVVLCMNYLQNFTLTLEGKLYGFRLIPLRVPLSWAERHPVGPARCASYSTIGTVLFPIRSAGNILHNFTDIFGILITCWFREWVCAGKKCGPLCWSGCVCTRSSRAAGTQNVRAGSIPSEPRPVWSRWSSRRVPSRPP